MSSKFPRTQWRLILHPAGQGARNMGIDEALLEAVGRHRSLPVLRLYAWDPPCLSIGYAQPIADVDLPRLEALAWQIVRRPTGGRAILHTDELTYAVIGPQDEPRLAGSILESYQVLSQAMLKALHILTVPAQSISHPLPADAKSPQNPVCFEVPSSYEITINGKKLLGSAQARRHEGVLQHGSLPITGDLTRITRVLAFPDETQRTAAAARLMQRAATLEAASGAIVEWQTAAQAFITAFERELNLEFVQSELTTGEVARAEELVREKYANPAWTGKI